MKNKIKISALLFVLFFAIGCNKWLNVNPQSEVGQEQLFRNEQGYIDALYGVYSNMAKTNLYGGDMPAVLDMLGKIWSVPDSHDFTSLRNYDYKNDEALAYTDKIWERLYYCIMLSNNILDHIENNTDVKLEYHDYIKGEALALRAFLHYEILKIYAPNIKEMPDYMAIPYKKLYSNDIEPQRTVKQILELVMADLTVAKELLANDVVRTNRPEFVEYKTTTDFNMENFYESKFLLDRKYRMNYYGVVGTMARIYMDMGKEQEAYDCANEVLTSGQYRYIRPEDYIEEKENKIRRDFMFNDEVVFALFSIHVDAYAKTRYTSGTVNKRLYIPSVASNNKFNEFFSAQGSDIRIFYFNEASNMGEPQRQLYRRADDNSNTIKRIRMITLHEMCMIAAEARPEKSVALLDALCRSREITSPIIASSTREQVMTFVAQEYRREYIGEGHFWNFVKRSAKSDFIASMTTGIGMIPRNLVVPLPAAEIEHGKRESEIWQNE